GGVVVRQNRNGVRGQAQTCRAVRQTGLVTSPASTQSAKCWCRGGGVCTVGAGGRVGGRSVGRQPHLTGRRTTRQKPSTAAFCLEEAATATVIRARDEAVIDALVGHLRGLSGCVHIAEAGQRLHLNVIDTAGNNQVSLTQGNLVHACFDGYRSGCTCTDWVNHRTVAANQRLHGVRCNNVS